MKAVVFIILQMVFATRTVLKIGEYSFQPGIIRSRDVFKPIARESNGRIINGYIFNKVFENIAKG